MFLFVVAINLIAATVFMFLEPFSNQVLFHTIVVGIGMFMYELEKLNETNSTAE